MKETQGARSGCCRIRLMLVSACLLTCFTPEVVQAADLIWSGDFETGDFSQYKSKLSGEGTRSEKAIVTSEVRSGRFATELTVLGLGTDGIERAELITKKADGKKMLFEWDGPEYWIGFSFLLKEWKANAFTFFQVHAPNESEGRACDFARNAFSIWGEGEDENGGIADKIEVRVIEYGGTSEGKGAASNTTVVHSYPMPFGKWQDYVVNFRLSTHGEGFFRIWKHGHLIYSRQGLTNVNHRDSCGNPIPKDQRRHDGVHVGIYSPGDRGYRRVFYDAVRVAEGADGYALVAPEDNGMAEAPKGSAPRAPVLH